LKFNTIIFLFTLLLLNSCSTVEKIGERINILKTKETPDVAGKLVCAAAGIESDDCVEAVKTEEVKSEENNNTNDSLESLNQDLDPLLLK